MPNDPTLTLVDALRAHAREHPERTAYVFLQDGEAEADRRSYAALDAGARAVAARLRERGAAAGDRALLLYPPGLDFITAFLGCLAAGVVAVPCYPPRPGRGQPRLKAILADAGARFALATSAIAGKLESLAAEDPEIAALERLATDHLPAALTEPAKVDGSTLAFLQYTSGSTSTPKGVMVTHGNLVFMERLLADVFQQDEASVVVGWLPVYHDMGLIGNVLQPLWLGATCVLMSPVAFLRRPRRWLEAVSRYRATTSGGPSFAYELCAARIGEDDRRGLDLSSWRVAFNGAEPVRASALERFAAAFAPCGFRREAFQPCYGLAEATLLVSGLRRPGGPVLLDVAAAALEQGRVEAPGEAAGRRRTLVGCGQVPAEQPVAVVDPATLRLCPPELVGELWVRGPGIAAGYWRRPEETDEAFGALVDGEGLWLRTGDLGFLRDGELFVTGRLKDLLILRGRNHYPQDLELTAESSAAGLALGANAAFAVEEDGEERLVVVQELAPRARLDAAGLASAAAAIRRAVAEEHEVQVWEVLLLAPGTVPKTSSGKIQRHATRALYLEGALEPLASSRLAPEPVGEAIAALDRNALLEAPAGDRQEILAAWLRAHAAAALRVAAGDLDSGRSLLDFGLDSLAAIELGQAIETALGVALAPGDLLEGAGVEDLARVILGRLEDSAAPHEWVFKQEDVGPLPHGQRGLWLLHRLDPQSTAYHLAGAMRIHGDVSAQGLRRAFQALVDRHPALRTTFHEEGGEPVQRIHHNAEVSFEKIDTAGLEEAAWRPFDLETGPLLRVSLFDRGAEGRVLLVVVHHIIADFWSFGVMAREIADGPGGERGDMLSPVDFARWQTEWLAGPEGERLWRAWRDRLAGLPPLDLPVDRPRPPTPNERAGCRRIEIGPEVLADLKALARSRGATLYAVLLAAFQVLLHRSTGQTDFAVGSPAAGRSGGLPGLADAVGYFVSPVALRADLAAEPTFLDLLDRTRRHTLEALDLQALPLPLLVEKLRAEGREADLFRVLFVLHRAPLGLEDLVSLALGEAGGRLRLGWLELEPIPLPPRAAAFDVTLAVGERRGALGAALVYRQDLLDAPTAARWLEHFSTLLAGAAAHPEMSVADLPLLPACERHQVLVESNDVAGAEPAWTLLHEGFEQQAARTPDAVALIDGERRMTYRDLDLEADRLAGRLREMGAGPEAVVGVHLPRTAEMVIALLAVLKSGAAYLPLDASYPEERIELLVEDARAVVVIEPDGPGRPLPRPLPRASPSPPPRAGEGRHRPLTGDGLAYLIYTSGSTGRPKGVAITHASAVRLVAWAGEAYSRDELAAVLAATSINFDLSVFEIFVPLSFGGAVVLAENALALPGLPAAAAVTLVNTVPSAIAGLLDLGPLPPSVRTVNLAGEPLRRSLAERVLAAGVKLWDLYGPSEDTTYSTGAPVRAGEPAEPSIGRPVAGSRAYVLDAGLRLAPLGIPGELCLGGGGLARGYLGRPDLTAERFVPDPFSAEPGSRLNRTGDLVRRAADGALDYLGRLDHQVKIRGFRIEPGEIEAALLAVPGVREAVVVARDGALVAYVVGLTPGQRGEALREALRASLPAPFIPSAFVILDALPLTPNGKVDRKALPAPEEMAGPAARSDRPVGPVEEALAAIWTELLGSGTIGRHERFFDRGGHSLLAARLVARVRDGLGVEIPLAAVFAEPTLAGLARRIEPLVESGSRDDAAPIPRAPRSLPLPLSYAQQRLWFLERLQPGTATYNVPLVLDLRGPLDRGALGRAVDELVRRHEALRTTFPVLDDGSVQRISPVPIDFPLPFVDVSGLTPDRGSAEADRWIKAEARRPFDLQTGPMLRALLMATAAEEHRLLLTLHHIACDGWSLGVLLAELGALYGGAALPVPALQAADHAAWQQAQAIPDGLLAHWRDRLAGAPGLELPADRPRPVRRSLAGATLFRELPAHVGSGLAAAARAHGATLFMGLLAGFAALLSRHTGQTDLVLGTVVAGRGRKDLEGVVGCFINTLALRIDLSGASTFAELLAQARSVALAAFQNQELPFERLVEEHRETSGQPFPRALLVLQNAPLAPPELDGLEVSARQVDTGTARAGLALSLRETAAGLEGAVELRTDLFDIATIERLWTRFGVLLAGAAADPAAPLADLILLPESERHQVLVEWTDTRETVQLPSIVDLFARRVAASPDALAVALADAEQSVTFAELDRRSSGMARRLRRLGVGPGRIVGVCVERSVDLPAAILGVWKAGGAYLPLDPGYPDARLALLIADGLSPDDKTPPVAVVQEALRDRLTAIEPRLLPAVAEEDEADPEPQPSSPPRPGDPAYVIYTSGTTGVPKGVVVEHGSLASLLAAVQRAFGFAADDRMPCVAPFSFDVFLFELFAPLLAGGCSLLHGLRPTLDVDHLAAGLGGLTRLHAVPALMRQIADAGRAAGPYPRMRSVFVGGDRVPAALLADLRALFPHAGLHVLYGPTEATILATRHTAEDAETGSPIGRPLDGVVVRLADPAGRPVPIGVGGEIWIGGAGVSRGYHRRPELTAERFPVIEGRRFYRSGDLARWRLDGVLEFLGRLDDQVKIRGFRIEPGEVEAALVRQPGVRAAAVLAREGQLAAYVVPFTPAEPQASILAFQEGLGAELPAHMIPTAWRLLPELPLTVHGKVDRSALAALGTEVRTVEGEWTPPRNPLEELLAAIWADVLGVERVGAHDNFFSLGGHSLLATRVMTRVRAVLGAEVPLAALFDAPTVAGMASALETPSPPAPLPAPPALSPGEGRQEETERVRGLSPLSRRAVGWEMGEGPGVRAPLSFAQQRLWFLDRLEPGSAAYNLPVALRLRGRLDTAALASALGEIVRRHEALRTTFPETPDGPVQEIASVPGDLFLPVEDVAALGSAAEAVALRRMDEEARRPFDLQRGPVVRPRLLRIAAEDHLLVVSLHHIAGDAWSMGILVRELAALYPHAVGGSLSPLPVQYADFAVWQRSWLAGDALAAELAWWRAALCGLPERLDLPIDHPRRATERRRGARRPVQLDRTLTRDVERIARREGATPFMMLLAVFQALLGRYAGQEDLAVGSPVAGRNRVELEGLIGFFVNTLVLRGDLSGDPDVRELVKRTRSRVLAAHAHQHLPFEKLVEEIAPQRELGATPLFAAMLAYQGPVAQPPELPGLDAEIVPIDTGTAKLDLLLDLGEQDGAFTGSLEYDTGLFEAATIDRFLGHFRTLLAAAAVTPDQRVADLPLLSEAERRQMVEEWNAHDPEPLPWTRLHEGFERQAARTPDAVALIWGHERITYSDLDTRANRLAARLRELGAGPERVVGIRLPRTPDMVIAMLAVLKAGAAYVPLDPTYPEERIAFMVEDADVGLVVEEGGIKSPSLPAPLPSPAQATDLAYLIYTSGSTGRPKGVAIEHASALRLVAWARRAYSDAELAGVLASTSINFDLSIFEIFVPLSWGGTVILADDALALATLPAAGEVTLLNTVPSAMAGLLELGALPPRLRTVNLAGEPLRRALADRVHAAGVERIWNLYGPSEDTTYSTGSLVDQDTAEPSIGRPVAGSRAYVVDRGMRLQPAGVPGELVLGGGGLARGYLRRPDLTAERFGPDPFGGTPGSRLYRTGDLARQRPDGTVEYLGRIDRQVKIRGFRIEPGEVEAALLAHPEVREAAVVARDGQLVAFVVGGQGGEALRTWLRDRLPAPLVPGTFVALDALPLTPNGKVDRAALAQIVPIPSGPTADAAEAPRGFAEETLAALWSAVLEREVADRSASFFDLGGHSLLATRVVSRVRGAFGVEIPIRAVFETPTIAGLAEVIARATGSGDAAPPLVPASERPAPLSFAQQRLWFLAQLDPSSAVYNLPLAVDLRGDLDVPCLTAALREIVRRHEALRTTFHVIGAEPVQVVGGAEGVLLPVVDLSGAPGGEARRLTAEDAGRPFDLQKGSVFRSLLLRLGPAEHRLVVTLHHIASDGWSLGVFTRELAGLYKGFGEGRPPALPELPVQYSDFAIWQRRWLTGDVLARELAFWKEELRGLPPGLDLPTDRPRPPLQTFRGGSRPFVLDAGSAAGLRRLARAEGATLFMALLASFQSLLARVSGQDDLAVGTPVAGRTRAELEGLIGFFVNTLVLRVSLADDPAFRELVARTRERCLAVSAHQDLPFERLVEELKPERNLARPPLFQVLLVFQNTPRVPLDLPGLDVQARAVETGTAKFELHLSLEESAGGLAGALEYNRDLFDAATVDRLLGHYATILGAAADPGLRLSDLPVLTAPERHQLVTEWNDGQDAPCDRTLIDLFAEQASLRPDAVAVSSGADCLTYGELDQRAAALARLLRALGAAPEERVAIYLERSPAMIVALIAVLKTGAAYVPLDPEHPAERQALVLGDARPCALVTNADLAARLTVPEQIPILLSGAEHEGGGLPSPARGGGLEARAGEGPGEGAAYIIYTSGSTGRPKGVMVTHAAVVRLLASTAPWFRFGPDDVWTLFHSFAFDFSVWEIWGALAHGGRLVIVPHQVSRSPDAFYDLLADEGVTVLNQTPSAFRQLIQAESDRPAPRPLALRAVVFGGEALDPASLAPWLARYGDQQPRLINMYGITETTVHVTFRPISLDDLAPVAGSPLGRPIPDLQVHLLDRWLQPAPIGVPGEICVGGQGLARGYFGRPGLTAERFLPDPFAERSGARLYRSGDLARRRPDGDVEYLGRIDFQVKIRGFRIELGEIEAALETHPAVLRAAVLARDGLSGVPGDRRLVAYVVPRNGALPLDELRASLRRRLPEHMVPAAFVLLDVLPLTANGKLDRRALPAPDAAPRGPVVAPRTATEEAIAAAWRDVLSLPAVGVDDSFFDLGGHSLLIVQVHRRLAEQFPDLAVVDLFRYPTIAALAQFLAKERVDQVSLAESRERADSRSERARQQRERRRKTQKP